MSRQPRPSTIVSGCANFCCVVLATWLLPVWDGGGHSWLWSPLHDFSQCPYSLWLSWPSGMAGKRNSRLHQDGVPALWEKAPSHPAIWGPVTRLPPLRGQKISAGTCPTTDSVNLAMRLA